MKISVVIPVYNVEAYLDTCVRSLLDQTLQPFEIILVDDGSKDSSGIICDGYAAEYDHIKVIHKANAGLGMARNTGLEQVTGDYVMFLDSDDFLREDCLEKFSAILEESGCDTCKGSFCRVDMQGNHLNDHSIEPGVFSGDEVRRQMLPRLIGSAPDKKDSIPMSACCTLYSVEILRQHGILFVSEREWISEDAIFNIEYYNVAQKVVLSDYIGYCYRTNPHSLTTTYRADRFEKCLAMYRKQQEILTGMGLYELCKFRLIRQFFIYLRMCFNQLNKKSCKLSTQEILRQFRKICADEQVQDMIRQFPVRKMGFKQQMFVYMVKYRMSILLYLLYGVKLIPGMG